MVRMARKLAAMEPDQFRRLVDEVLDSLPRRLRARIANVEFVVESSPTPEDLERAGLEPEDVLLGLYHGIPLPDRSDGYSFALPDKISIYQEPIEFICASDDEVREEVRITVLHEIGHYFGIGEERLGELGLG